MEAILNNQTQKTPNQIIPPPKSPKSPHKSHRLVVEPQLKRQISTQKSYDDASSNIDFQFNSNFNDLLINHNDSDDDMYVVLYDYKANQDDELTLVKGSLIKVLSKDYRISGDDGWWTGYSIDHGKKGIFPSNYVEPFVRSNKRDSKRSSEEDNLIDFESDEPITNNNNKKKQSDAKIETPSSTSTLKMETTEDDFSRPNEKQPKLSSSLKKKKSSSSRELPPHIPYAELEFKDVIGAGGFGKVYKGYWIHDQPSINDKAKSKKYELVAIKEARVEGDKDDLLTVIKQNVLQEAKLFWILRHPNIIQLKGICFQEPHFCLVMEYAKGGSLGRLLGVRKIGFPPYVLIKWALQVSQGMYYLHEQALPNRIPIVHRDLKSSNILLSEDASINEHRLSDIILKLTDFGLARELQKTTNEMSAAGTYSHMPPEVIKSSTYSKASDVWSFGVLLWELLTGEVPYKGIDPLAIAYGVAVNKLTLPIPSTCPQIFSDLIHACWHTDPYKRLSFEQIMECLIEISNSPFATTPNESFWTMQQDWKTEIQEMFTEIKNRENELRSREEELERISMRQQAYESMLRQREKELEEREKDLAFRELTVALQQLNPMTLAVNQQAPPPEPKKRRRVGGLFNTFLRSSSSNTNANSNGSNNSSSLNSSGIGSSILTSAKSIDISSPSDFHHCLSVQPEILNIQQSNSSVSLMSNSNLLKKQSSTSSPTDEQPDQISYFGNSLNTTSNSHLLLSPVGSGSPNLRLKIMVPPHQYDTDRKAGLVHQKTLSPNRSRERLHPSCKSNSVDNNDSHLVNTRHMQPHYHQLYQHQQQQPQHILQPQQSPHNQKLNHNSRAKNRSQTTWYNHEEFNRSYSADVNPITETKANPSDPNSLNNNLSSCQSPIHTKKISKILYEIGSILSFVGLGKDYKPNNSSTQTINTNTTIINTPTIPNSNGGAPISNTAINSNPTNSTTPSAQSTTLTRRSQDKKHTPSSAINIIDNTHITPNANNNLLTANSALSPNKSSHSLTRLHRTYPYRFKSLTSQSSNAIDDPIELTPNYKLDSQKENRSVHNSNNKLSPLAAKTAATVLAASAAAAAAASNTANLSSSSSSNLLSPIHFINNSNSLSTHNQMMLKQMQKKYSKSVDCSHYADANLNGANPSLVSSSPGGSSLNINNGVCTIGITPNSNSNSRNNIDLDSIKKSTDSLHQYTLQRQHSHTNSPLIPRRNDYEPMTRVTIQRQQRVNEQSPTKTSTPRTPNFDMPTNKDNQYESNHYSNKASIQYYTNNPSLSNTNVSVQNTNANLYYSANSNALPGLNRPITLDLKNAFNNQKQNEITSQVSLSTNEDDDIDLIDTSADAGNLKPNSTVGNASAGNSYRSSSIKTQLANSRNKPFINTIVSNANSKDLNTNQLISSSLSLSSSIASSSLPSSLSPTATSPRAIPPQHQATAAMQASQQQLGAHTNNLHLIHQHSLTTGSSGKQRSSSPSPSRINCLTSSSNQQNA